jgi:hypothetical protein
MTLHGENMFFLVTCVFFENTENHKSEVNDPYIRRMYYVFETRMSGMTVNGFPFVLRWNFNKFILLAAC